MSSAPLQAPPPSPPSLKDDYREAYRYHSSTLRNWYVAFGVGAPVLFLTNEHLWQKVVASPWHEMIASTFFIGVAFQVVLAFFDKYANWVRYYEAAIGTEKPFLHAAAKWWMEDDFLSIVLDLGSLFLFGFATFLAFSAARG